jgi:pimeloyl-ACP methyl ester carboxylesterase
VKQTEYHQVEYEGIALAYTVYGLATAPPVCLVHGYCDRGSVWAAIAQALASDYRVIVPDLPGFGASELPSMLATSPSIAGYADGLQAVLDHAGSKRAVLIGHSMGGYVSLAYAERLPNRVRGLGLFHSHAFADDEAKKEARQKTVNYIRRHGARKFIGDFARNLFSEHSRETKPTLVERHIARVEDTTEDALACGMEAMIARPDRTSVLRDAPWPVLFVLGRFDDAIPLHQGLRQVALPESAQVELFEQSGHMGMLEASDESLHLLRKYLEHQISAAGA